MRYANVVLALAPLVLVACRDGADGKHADAVPQLETIRVTGIPDENPTELIRKFQPMADYLERELGRKVKYVPVTDVYTALLMLKSLGIWYEHMATYGDHEWRGGKIGLGLFEADTPQELIAQVLAAESVR